MGEHVDMVKNTDEPSYLTTARKNAVRPSDAEAVQLFTQGYAHGHFKLPLEPSLTRFLPLQRDDERPSPLSEADQNYIKAKYQRDMEYMQKRRQAFQGNMKRLEQYYTERYDAPPGVVYDWLGPLSDQQPASASLKIVSEKERQQKRASGKRGNLRAVWPSKYDSAKIANEDELLIPIRLEIEHENIKIRDTFTWNLRDGFTKPEMFVNHLLADMQLPQATHMHFRREILTSVNDALSEARGTAWEANVLSSARTEDHDEDEWEIGRPSKKPRLESEKSWTLEELQTDSSLHLKSHDELRILVKLDITVDGLNLTDTIEWDLSDPYNSPEDFANLMAIDLGLNGEFATAIAHSIREQVDSYARSLGMIEHRPGAPVVHDELRHAFLGPIGPASTAHVHHLSQNTMGLPGVPNPHVDSTIPAIRSTTQAKQFTPHLDQLSPDQILHSTKEREREARRKRRNTKGRQRITLPDRDPVKTHRSLMPRPGGKEPQFFDNKDGEHMLGEFDIATRPALANGGRRKPCYYWTEEEAALEEELAKAPRYRSAESDETAKRKLEAMNDANLPPGAKKRRGPLGRPKKLSKGMPPGLLDLDSRAGSVEHDLEMPVSNLSMEALAAIGQHPNIIDGVWHCTNCGAPDGVAVGRRKGPAGEKTLCAACGKFWIRYKRNRPCEYMTSADRHRELMAQEEEAERLAAEAHKHSRKKSAPAKHSQQVSAVTHTARQGTPMSDMSSMRDSSPDEVKPPKVTKSHTNSVSTADKAAYVPGHASQSSASSSAAPLANTTPNRPQPSTGSKLVGPASALPPHMAPRSVSSSSLSGGAPARTQQHAPQWIIEAHSSLHAKYPEDAFEIIAKHKPATVERGQPTVEWRVRCSDCPGKLYTPGPEQTLNNFEVHLKNRNHRANVAKRLRGGADAPASNSNTPTTPNVPLPS